MVKRRCIVGKILIRNECDWLMIIGNKDYIMYFGNYGLYRIRGMNVRNDKM